jgi:hypothetical protein
MQPSTRPPAPQPRDTRAETLRALQRGDDIATVSTGTGLLIEATPVDPTQVYDVRISELRGDGRQDVLLGARIPAAGALPALDALLDPAMPDLVLTRTDRAALLEQVHQLRAALHEATHTVVPAEIAARMNSAPERRDSPVPRDGVAGAEPGATTTGPAPPEHRALTIEDAVAELAARRRPGLLSVHQAAHEALDAREAAHRRAAQLTLARLAGLVEAGQAEHEAARTVTAHIAAEMHAEVGRALIDHAREARVLAVPVTDAHIDAAASDFERGTLVDLAACQQALVVLGDRSWAQMAEDTAGLYLEYRDRHGYPPEQAHAATTSEVTEGIHADYEIAAARIADAAEQRGGAPDAAGDRPPRFTLTGAERQALTDWQQRHQLDARVDTPGNDNLGHDRGQLGAPAVGAHQRHAAASHQPNDPDRLREHTALTTQAAATDPARRWAPIVRAVAGEAVTADAGWPGLAAGLDRAAASGWDVAANLPRLVAQRDMPARHPAQELYCRLGRVLWIMVSGLA